MNKNKIRKKLLNNINILNLNTKQTVFVSCLNFNKTKTFLNDLNYKFKPYRFANCFSVEADIEDIKLLSCFDDINFIHSNSTVQTTRQENNLIHIENLTENKYFGQNQTICFIDTGIFPHFDFIFPKSRIVKFIDLTNNKSYPYDDNGHGTFVAGIACGGGIFSNQNIGFAPMANIISIKALNASGNSNSNTILDAMQWVYENHKAFNISVVCMSFGADILSNPDPLSSGAEALWNRGLTVVAAAGNSGPKPETIKTPGCNQHIITVGALDFDNMVTADFSSRGPTFYGHKPDLIAPAVNLTSCSINYLPYTTMSGTSVATPIIAGICAILKSKYPNITNNEIKKYLLSHCTKITGNIDQEGAGYINF